MRHEVESEVQGSVWKIEVAVGEHVAAGDVLIILESMKMEIPVESPVAGVVSELRVTVEAAVDEEEVVVVIDSDD
jgi:biotin carboxyl carrier protein